MGGIINGRLFDKGEVIHYKIASKDISNAKSLIDRLAENAADPTKGVKYGIDTKAFPFVEGFSDITAVKIDLNASRAQQLVTTYKTIKNREPDYNVLNYNCSNFVQEGLGGVDITDDLPSNSIPDVYIRNLILQGYEVVYP